LTLSIKIKTNPEYASLVPALSALEYEQLKQSIKQDGLKEAITINQNGIVLDGHHRLRACQELGIEPRIEYKSFASNLDEKLHVIDCNLIRRQLSEFARIKLALIKKPILEELGKQRMLSGKKLDPGPNSDEGNNKGRTDQKIADSANTS